MNGESIAGISGQSLEQVNNDFSLLLERRKKEDHGKSFCEELKRMYGNLPSGLRVIFELDVPTEPKLATEERLRDSLEKAGIIEPGKERACLVVQSPFTPRPDAAGDSSTGRVGIFLNRSAIQTITISPDCDLEKGKMTGDVVYTFDVNPLGTFSRIGIDYFYVYPDAIKKILILDDKSIALSPVALKDENRILPVEEWN